MGGPVSSYDFELTMDVVFNWGDPVIGVHRTYLSDNIREGVIWSNTQQYENARVDELLNAAAVELDLDKRKALYAEFQQIVAEDLPIYWINALPYHTAYNARVAEPAHRHLGHDAPDGHGLDDLRMIPVRPARLAGRIRRGAARGAAPAPARRQTPDERLLPPAARRLRPASDAGRGGAELPADPPCARRSGDGDRGRDGRCDRRDAGKHPRAVRARTSRCWCSSGSMSRAWRGAIWAKASSSTSRSRKLIALRIGPTILLVVTAQILSIVIGVFLGVIAAAIPNGPLSAFVSVFATIGYAVPVFWTGIMLIILFASHPADLSGGGDAIGAAAGRAVLAREVPRRAASPGAARLHAGDHLPGAIRAPVTRLDAGRSGLGLHPHRTGQGRLGTLGAVQACAAQRALPILTVAGLQFGNLISGALLVETVFNWPGMGRLAFDSILRRDYPTVLGVLFFASAMVVVANILTDLSYRLADPRLRGQS
jgi:peptide/nickel transport system permease protein